MSDRSVVLVTGGSRGLGFALVRGLLDAGYTVGTVSRSSTAELEALVASSSGRLLHAPADLADAEAVGGALGRIEHDLGPVDTLVNNAGIARDGVLAVMPPADVEELIRVNLTGTLLLTRRATRSMIRRRRGNVVTISSIVGLRGYAGLAAYAATKAGLDGMTRALARELGPRNIRVNSIAPGYLETEMVGGLGDVQREQIVRRTPLGRLGRPEDVVGALLFLLSPAAAFVTGQTLVIDGGITC